MVNKNHHIDSKLQQAFQELVTPEVNALDWNVVEQKLGNKESLVATMRLSFSFFVLAILLLFNLKINHLDFSNVAFEPIFDNEFQSKIVLQPIEKIENILIENEINNYSINAPSILETITKYNLNNYNPDKSKLSTDKITSKSELNFPFINEKLQFGLIDWLVLDLNIEEETTELPKKLFTWEVQGNISPNTIGRIITDNVQLSGLIHKDFKTNVMNSEKGSLSSNYGLATNLSFGKFLFGVGLNITQWREQINYDYSIDYDIDVNLTENRIDNYVLRPMWRREKISLNRINEYNFVEIPLYVGYKSYISPRFEWRNKMGVLFTHMTSFSGELADYTSLNIRDIQELDRFRNNTISTQLSSGVYYHKNRFFIGAEPFYSVSLSGISNNSISALNIRPFNYGLSVSAGFVIKSNNKSL